MQNISKRLIVAIIVLIIVIVSGGWFWYISKAPMQQQVVPVTDNQSQQGGENQTQETSTEIIARNLDVSTWKTYRNEQIGIEFKYPNEEGWIFEEKDYSKDSSQPYWPMKSVSVFYDSDYLVTHSAPDKVDFIFASSQYNNGSVFPVDSKDTYNFNFKGQHVAGSMVDKDILEKLFDYKTCDKDIHFELPNLPRISDRKEKEAVSINIMCSRSAPSNGHLFILQTILQSVNFFSPIQ
jgi:hypothetical protein